ncbi:MAG: hydrolase [Lachnospiraceae bacterium]|jgi:predicted hydrolase (HD superfamily)
MGKIPNIDEARALMEEYNKEDFHRKHAECVSAVMGEFAKKYDGENVEFWKVVGMLHDLDFEKFPEEHCVKGEEIMREAGLDESIIRSTCSHGFGLTESRYEPEHIMEKILFAVDELTGLIGACALMRPSRSCKDMELKSLKKKFKDKSFAAGCSRNTIRQGAEMLGWELDDLLNQTLEAMKTVSE